MNASKIITSRVAMRSRSRAPLCASLLGALALGCSSDGIDLGGGTVAQNLQLGARCAESPIVEGDVLVTSQQELADLAGCEEIVGALEVQMFADADLSPLAALRVIEGALALGTSRFSRISPEEFEDRERVEALEAEEAALQGTWLTSLVGLESLERSGELQIFATGITDLEPLASLQRLGGIAGTGPLSVAAGAVLVVGNPALVSLAGLENVSGIDRVEVVDNEALVSLGDLQLEEFLDVFNAAEVPRLTDISALSGVTGIATLVLDATGLTDLTALSSVRAIGESLFVMNNTALVDASALSSVEQCPSLFFSNNAVLEALPPFTEFFNLPERITIERHPMLESIEIDMPFAISLGPVVGGQLREFGTESIIISDNAQLGSVSFIQGPSDAFGLRAAQIVALERNPSLTRVDFGGIRSADLVVLNDNAALAEVGLGVLERVDTLELTGNPSLDGSVFDAVQTFERIESPVASAP